MLLTCRPVSARTHRGMPCLIRLPPHGHIMTVLRTFHDDASTLPDWRLDPEIVNPRTQMVSAAVASCQCGQYGSGGSRQLTTHCRPLGGDAFSAEGPQELLEGPAPRRRRNVRRAGRPDRRVGPATARPVLLATWRAIFASMCMRPPALSLSLSECCVNNGPTDGQATDASAGASQAARCGPPGREAR